MFILLKKRVKFALLDCSTRKLKEVGRIISQCSFPVKIINQVFLLGHECMNFLKSTRNTQTD